MSHWHDDSWKDSYDAWKLRSPDDECIDRCYHEDYEIGYDGIAHCNDCFERWTATADEIAHQRERSREYDRWCRRQEFRERWFGWWDRLQSRWRTFWFLRRQGWKPLVDDDIPF